MISRRAMVGRLAAGTVAVCTVGAARVSLGSTGSEAGSNGQRSAEEPSLVDAEPPATHAMPGPWELLSPLSAGAAVIQGWRVTDLSSVTNGSCVVTLENERGRSHRVHLCANDGNPQGLVFTKHVDLVVMNGGRGDLPTEEGFAQAVAEVAHVLASNEQQQSEVLAGLLPHAERLTRFTGSAQLR